MIFAAGKVQIRCRKFLTANSWKWYLCGNGKYGELGVNGCCVPNICNATMQLWMHRLDSSPVLPHLSKLASLRVFVLRQSIYLIFPDQTP